VLLAGVLMTSVSWLPNVAVLGAAHPVVAVDAVGDAGRSMHDRPVRTRSELASWFDELLNGLEVERAHVGPVTGRRLLYRPKRCARGSPQSPPIRCVIWRTATDRRGRADRATAASPTMGTPTKVIVPSLSRPTHARKVSANRKKPTRESALPHASDGSSWTVPKGRPASDPNAPRDTGTDEVETRG
jgi:hypothetical protein